MDLNLLTVVAIVAVGAGVGFLGGLLGKGGSAIATPMLVAIGIPPIVALAAPLPATVPATLVAADRYRRRGMIDLTVLRWSLVAGVPATVVGAVATRWVDAGSLVVATEVLIVAIGLRMVVGALRGGRQGDAAAAATDADEVEDGGVRRNQTIAVAVVTGLAAGLLANSGGFLLAPLFIAVLGLGVRPALGTSLAAASVLAVPGTLVHLALGHLDLVVVAAFAVGSIPLSGLGARMALDADSHRLEVGYGAALTVMGLAFLAPSMI